MLYKDSEITGIVIRKLRQFSDKRGWLTELFREDELPDGFRPVMGYLSLTHPGVVRGPHEHIEQTDYFCFFGKFSLYMWDNRKDSPTFFNRMVIADADTKLIIVPPGIVHAYKNTGTSDAFVLNFPDRLYAGWGKREGIDEVRYEDDPETVFRIDS